MQNLRKEEKRVQHKDKNMIKENKIIRSSFVRSKKWHRGYIKLELKHLKCNKVCKFSLIRLKNNRYFLTYKIN
jgi:hypothetical protein